VANRSDIKIKNFTLLWNMFDLWINKMPGKTKKQIRLIPFICFGSMIHMIHHRVDSSRVIPEMIPHTYSLFFECFGLWTQGLQLTILWALPQFISIPAKSLNCYVMVLYLYSSKRWKTFDRRTFQCTFQLFAITFLLTCSPYNTFSCAPNFINKMIKYKIIKKKS
jgi:hypothetical protein